MLILAAVLAALIGVVLGMLGGGGAILTLPMLVYALGVDPREAIASSLFMVAMTSAVGVVLNARSSCVDWRRGLPFGVAAMVGAFAGGRLAKFVPATILLVLFAAMMVAAAIGMVRGRSARGEPTPTASRLPVLALGVGVGFLGGLVGAGGGFILVPALALVVGLPIRRAIGTSLLVITMQSCAGFAGQASNIALDWPLVLTVTGASVVGTVAGAYAGRRLAPEMLRRAFAWLVALMGLFMLAKQLPAGVGVAVALAGGALFVIAARRAKTPAPLAEAR